MSKKSKKSKKYDIYGIVNFDTQELLSVSLNWEELTLEYDLASYSDSEFDIDIIAFKIALTD